MSNKKISSRSIKVNYEDKKMSSRSIGVEYDDDTIVPRIILASRCNSDVEKGPQVCITKVQTRDKKALARDNQNFGSKRSVMSAEIYEAAFDLASRSRSSLSQDLPILTNRTPLSSDERSVSLTQDFPDAHSITKVDKNILMKNEEMIPYEKRGSRIGSEIIIKQQISEIEQFAIAIDIEEACCDSEAKMNKTPLLKKILVSICILVFFFAIGIGISFYVHH